MLYNAIALIIVSCWLFRDNQQPTPSDSKAAPVSLAKKKPAESVIGVPKIRETIKEGTNTSAIPAMASTIEMVVSNDFMIDGLMD